MLYSQPDSPLPHSKLVAHDLQKRTKVIHKISNKNSNNWVTMWRLGAWGRPGASTIGSQLLGGDCSHGCQILATWWQPWAHTWQGWEPGTNHTDRITGKKGVCIFREWLNQRTVMQLLEILSSTPKNALLYSCYTSQTPKKCPLVIC